MDDLRGTRVSGRCKVAVYGTLKRGCSNHTALAGATFLGEDVLSQITLFHLGDYPGAVLLPSKGVQIEVYELDASRLATLDALEEYVPGSPDNSLYVRDLIQTRYGDAWIYLYQKEVADCPVITHGNWCDHPNRHPHAETS